MNKNLFTKAERKAYKIYESLESFLNSKEFRGLTPDMKESFQLLHKNLEKIYYNNEL